MEQIAIIFNGGLSYLSENIGLQEKGEHRVMAELAEAKGLPRSVIKIPEPSNDTVTNFLTCVQLINSQEDIGILAHGDPLPRSLFLANLILPNPKVVGLEVFGSYDSKAIRQEQLLLSAARLLFAGVRKGELEKVKSRNKAFQVTSKSLKPVLKAIINNHTPYS